MNPESKFELNVVTKRTHKEDFVLDQFIFPQLNVFVIAILVRYH